MVGLVARGRVVGDEECFEGVGALFGVERGKGEEGEGADRGAERFVACESAFVG